MARSSELNSPRFFLTLIFFVATFLFSFTEAARPFNILKARIHPTEKSWSFFDGFSLGARAIKNSSPSPVGGGHQFTNPQTLGGIKADSGPNPGGGGHRFTNAKTLGGIKDNSGPSPGTGNKFTNAQTLEGIKNVDSRPGEVHKSTNSKTLGGVGHKFTNSKTLGGVKDQGPSPGQRH
ncbi:hypothetical protein NE237_023257 [Protea cynaroides]|uniref:Uncharacterized protein n=1 Tax=Protea cynaroides TaxID=273540 RepID=A0A9Q0K6H0_9MAGN|nr:hypothetical protein NE237_023257 [Protea cynaroides]